MPLAVNTKFDHYEIVAPLGKGGMGEVYRARDTRLNREVAIKVLPGEIAHDAERLRRFEQEARAVGALNHSNILTVYDFGNYEGNPYLVMELLEGEELRAQLDQGSLAPRKAMEYAAQMAAGLSAAHEKNIVHRDLKPENLFVTKDGRIKILDFGLAKLTRLRNSEFGIRNEEAETLVQGDPNNPQSAIRNPQLTAPGTVLGTISYMSPEQARGQDTDHRSDIFSAGLILYEMLAGQRAFERETMAETMTAIMKEDPPALPPEKIAPALDKIVQRCLEKKPARRFQSASDLGFALEALSSTGYASFQPASGGNVAVAETGGKSVFPARGRERIWMMVAGGLALALLALGGLYFRRAPAESRAIYTYLPWPEKTVPSIDLGTPAISHDGRRVAFTAATDGTNHIWLYSLDAPGPVRLQGTDGARFPFWSPDGRNLGFFSGGKLKRIEASGGTAETLSDAPRGSGGTWSSTGVILFAPDLEGTLYRVSDTGGERTSVTTLDTARFEYRHNFPRFLPDGRHFVFYTRSATPENIGIRVGSLDQPQTSFLLRANSNAEYSDAGYLLVMRGRKVLAAPFDAAKLTLTGEPVTLVEQGSFNVSDQYAPLTVLSDRELIYQSSVNPNTQLAWFDRSGRQLSLVGAPGEYRWLSLAPDGSQVILERYEPQKVHNDLWLFDLTREMLTRVTASPFPANFPLWAGNGRRIAFGSNRDGVWTIWQKGVSGSDDTEELLCRDERRTISLEDWSRDEQYLVYRKTGEKTSFDLWLQPLFGNHQPKPYLATQFDETWAKVSPDGHWMAYQSNESGRFEIYVQSFPEPGRKVAVSKGGGIFPRWRRDGRELYFVAADDKLMAAPVETGANFSSGAPVPLFDVGSYGRRNNRYVYDVSADGQKILLLRPLEDDSTRPLTVVQNWTALLKK